MLSKIQELTDKKNTYIKFLIIPCTSYYIHEGATSLGQVRISPKVLSNRLYLPCALCWLYVVHLLTYDCFDHRNYYFISGVLKEGNPRGNEYLDRPRPTKGSLKTAFALQT